MASEAPVSIGVERSYTKAILQWLWAGIPLWGAVFAAALIVSRRPDAVTSAQFWAEDGKLFYANVYNHGLLATLVVPQAGYFQELPILAARIAQVAPLALGPLIMNSIGIAFRVLPVGLLLSRRAETISPDLRVRALLAALYIALPGSAETNANAVNAAWYLAVAAVLVLMLRPPVGKLGRALDIAILALCSVTGVFVIALAPLAFVYRRVRGASAVPNASLAILAAGAALQLVAILVLQYHLPSGFEAAQRPAGPLHGSSQLLFEILGLRVFAEPVLGNGAVLSGITAAFLGVLGLTGMAMAVRLGSSELRLMTAFGLAMFAMALARPLGTDWPGLMSAAADSRYFVIPQFAAIAALVWACGYNRHTGWIIPLAAVFLYMCVIAIPNDWEYAPFGKTNFAHQASQFEHAPVGTRMTIPIEPPGWSMTLLKH
jgi:hypothetical protein